MRSIYPHSEEFKKDHGKFATSFRVQCLNCHGSDGSGGTAKVACTTCHSYPHPAGWAMPSVHSKTYLASQDKQKDCLNCHMKESVAKERSCKVCHSAYPHEENFGDGESVHKKYAKDYAGKCLICHTEFTRNLPKDTYGEDGCKTCHSGAFEIKFPLSAPGAQNLKKHLERVPSARR